MLVYKQQKQHQQQLLYYIQLLGLRCCSEMASFTETEMEKESCFLLYCCVLIVMSIRICSFLLVLRFVLFIGGTLSLFLYLIRFVEFDRSDDANTLNQHDIIGGLGHSYLNLKYHCAQQARFRPTDPTILVCFIKRDGLGFLIFRSEVDSIQPNMTLA